MNLWPNFTAAVDAPIGSLFHIVDHRRRTTEQRRSLLAPLCLGSRGRSLFLGRLGRVALESQHPGHFRFGGQSGLDE